MDDTKVCFYVCPPDEVNNFIIILFFTEFIFLLPTNFNGSVMHLKSGLSCELKGEETYGGIHQYFFFVTSVDRLPFPLVYVKMWIFKLVVNTKKPTEEIKIHLFFSIF